MVRHLPFASSRKSGKLVVPILESERLILRPPRHADIQAMAVWLGDFQVSKNLARVPHPYGEADAEEFVTSGARKAEDRYAFSIVRRADQLFLGGIGLGRGQAGHELGYWLGKPFWGFRYASEAAARLMHFAFEIVGLSSVHAGWFHDNPASGHVLAKLGARHNGSRMRPCLARGAPVLCHEMLLTREAFLSKKAPGFSWARDPGRISELRPDRILERGSALTGQR